MKKTYKKNSPGFTLLEVLVAVLLLSVTVAALLTLVADSVNSATYGKNDITATYLGQEALDYIRNTRDTQLHQGGATTWNSFLDDPEFGNHTGGIGCYSADGCELDVFGLRGWQAPPFIESCSGPCREFQRIVTPNLSGASYFSLNGIPGSPTGFTRTIRLKQPRVGSAALPANDVLYVEVTVSWHNGATLRSKVFSETLYNWQL